MLTANDLENLRNGIRGAVIQPHDPSYDEARRVYNAMIDRRPRVIVQCGDVADVMRAVAFARDHDLALAVRGGAHNGAGLGVCDDGLVVDLRNLRGVRVDPVARTVRVEGGCTWGDVDHATHAFGLATPSGFISTTGVGGLTLGGGIGYLTRTYGLTVDNLVSADIVLADGRLVTASADQNPDLFWALRGGGGNFGAVTSFEFRAHPVSTVYGGPMLWPIERADTLMATWRDFILDAPEEVNGWLGLVTVPPAPPFPEEHHLKQMCAVVWCDTAPLGAAERRFETIRREFGAPAIDFVGPVPFPALQSLFDPLYPPGLQWYWKADFFKDLSNAAIDRHVEHGARLPTLHSTMHLYPINGAAQRVGRTDTAFSYRDANFAQVIVAVAPDPSNNSGMISWARDYWDALHPYSAGGAYINMIMDEGQEQVKAAYRDNYERLVATKSRYDPDNLFRINQNIRPVAA
ncbi:MAG TPA: FAD-binding oxidoreductase [Gammaproteobacteria bacterium]|nr:FAD-binding oxidoreductase [Gammaproteobacteria bacterium]